MPANTFSLFRIANPLNYLLTLLVQWFSSLGFSEYGQKLFLRVCAPIMHPIQRLGDVKSIFGAEKEGTQMEQLHDVRSAARLLAVSPWTVRVYIRQGKLHPVRIGRLVRLE